MMPKIYVQHPAVNGGERLLLVVAMLPRIDDAPPGARRVRRSLPAE